MSAMCRWSWEYIPSREIYNIINRNIHIKHIMRKKYQKVHIEIRNWNIPAIVGNTCFKLRRHWFKITIDSCHKLWLSKADFTWLILMSHKVCWISHYDVTWLIVLTWLRTRESLLYFDWLMVSWLTMVTSYDVMTFAHDSYYESWVSRVWLV